ncbi:MAG: DUF5615 family PIN-like protein [Planctomycetaceae bacterium]|nr:DUF5615 family PIN-like protein [Planctomycetaceae bacterium]
MLRTIRFHLDENCPTAIAEGLRRRGIDVTTTPEAGLIGATDEEQTAHARDWVTWGPWRVIVGSIPAIR